MSRDVMEQDLRAPEFRDGSPDDYERRGDGKIVRKDRWVRGMTDISAIVFGARHEFEISEVVNAVHRLQGVRMRELLDQAEEVFESSKEGLQVVEYIRAVINSQQKGDAA